MAVLGVLGLTIGFAAIAVSAACLIGYVIVTRKNDADAERSIGRVGHVAVIIGACALTFCCSILVYAFFAGDYTLNYVLANHSNSTGPLAWLYQFSALWAGREGSLLFWAWLISVFASIIAIRDLKGYKRLDSSALFVISLVLLAFVGVILFSEDNMPFTSTDESFFASEATLNSAIALYGMNPLLEHWAMAVHPPALFIGYAGMTIPFAYGLGTLICGENSSAWIDRSFKFAVFSLIFLTIGIGLGAIWAYVVLGWGGYWGWDPVENASLLPWLAGIALIHSFTVCRKHGTMKRWCVFCACLAFSFVIVGTFISRSGLVQSVHAFEGDPVSLWLFGSLIVIPLAAGAIGLILRRKSFGVKDPSIPEMESMASKDAAYYFNNVILIAFAVVLTYLTISSALPEIPFLPFSGSSVSSTTYDLIVRPLGVFYLAIFAVCPLLSWSRTDGALFWKRARIPLACGLVIFACLLIYFFMALLPAYNTTIEAGGTNADTLLEQGPSWYYNGI
ncbi:MAG: cytochrome c biogenesis protein CcsA, partial [Eggerthellaceae bacterium]|nr:cytochrome c biogenesis protein CcsA [Eggerthellaceae bacterium]